MTNYAKVLALRNLCGQSIFTLHHRYVTTLACFFSLSDFNKRNGIHSLKFHKISVSLNEFSSGCKRVFV